MPILFQPRREKSTRPKSGLTNLSTRKMLKFSPDTRAAQLCLYLSFYCHLRVQGRLCVEAKCGKIAYDNAGTFS